MPSTPASARPAAPVYAFGHAPHELDRLLEQSRRFAPMTRRLFEAAGLSPGMRVLDLGSGLGDVALLAREIVGPSGRVVGVERAPEALAVARTRVAAAGWSNVGFDARAIDEAIDGLDEVDAIVGRFILMYLPDATRTLGRLVERLRPRLVAFQEIDIDAARSAPPVPTFDRCLAAARTVLGRIGTPSAPGLLLHRWFVEAGLPRPALLVESPADCGAGGVLSQHLQAVVRSLHPLMLQHGVCGPDELDLGTIAARIDAEAQARQATLVGPAVVGAWCRLDATTATAALTSRG